LSPALDPAKGAGLSGTGPKSFTRRTKISKPRDAFKKATDLDPGLAEAYFRLGLAHDALGDKQEAEEAYKKAIDAYKKGHRCGSKRR